MMIVVLGLIAGVRIVLLARPWQAPFPHSIGALRRSIGQACRRASGVAFPDLWFCRPRASPY
eukprot:776515-Pyramimonas_sp.AAC.1